MADEDKKDQFAVEGNDTSAYVGVSEEYRNYANETEKPYPFEGEEGAAVKEQLEAGSDAESAATAVKSESSKHAAPKVTKSDTE